MAVKVRPFKEFRKRRRTRKYPMRIFQARQNKRLFEETVRTRPFYKGYFKGRIPEIAKTHGVVPVLKELGLMFDTKVFYVPVTGYPRAPALYVLAVAGLDNPDYPAIIYDTIMRQWYMELTWMEFIHRLAEVPNSKKTYQIGTLKELN